MKLIESFVLKREDFVKKTFKCQDFKWKREQTIKYSESKFRTKDIKSVSSYRQGIYYFSPNAGFINILFFNLYVRLYFKTFLIAEIGFPRTLVTHGHGANWSLGTMLMWTTLTLFLRHAQL